MSVAESNNDTQSEAALCHSISDIVSSGIPFEQMLKRMVSIVAGVTQCDACLVYLLQVASGELVLAASQLPHPAEIGCIHLKTGEGVTGWVAEHKSVVVLPAKAGEDPRFKRFAGLIEDTYEALLSAPLLSGGEVVGVINVHHRSPRAHPQEETRLLAFLGQQIGGAIARVRLMEENARLQHEALEVKRQLESRKIVERAKGILQQKGKLTEEDAYKRLRDESRRLRRPMRELAEAIILAEELAHGDHGSERPRGLDGS